MSETSFRVVETETRTNYVYSIDDDGVDDEAHHDPECDRHAPVLLEMQQVKLPVNGARLDTVMFFDNRATTTLCTHSWAAKAGLSGEDVPYYLRVVGGDYTQHNTKCYSCVMTDRDGVDHNLTALAMDTITDVERVPICLDSDSSSPERRQKPSKHTQKASGPSSWPKLPPPAAKGG